MGRGTSLAILRNGGSFLVNLMIAYILPGQAAFQLTRPLLTRHLHDPRTPLEVYLFADASVSAGVAFVLGYSVFRLWKRPEARWIWIAGIVWSLSWMLFAPNNTSVMDAFEGGIGRDMERFGAWAIIAAPPIRTAFYSAGAAVSDRIRKRRSTGAGFD
jgi:hypothetical protein